MRIWFVLGAAMFIAACAQDQKPKPVEALSWKAGPENSQIAEVRHDGLGPELIRCWPREEKQQCLRVWLILDLGFYAYRATFDTLPTEWNAPDSGYKCHLSTIGLGSIEESINRDGRRLTSSRTTTGDREFWSPAFVKKYMANNGVTGGAHFNCAKLTKELEAGSLETLNSTTITYRNVM